MDVDVSTSTWISFVMGSFKCFCKWEFVSVSDFDIGETEILPWWWLLDVDGSGGGGLLMGEDDEMEVEE